MTRCLGAECRIADRDVARRQDIGSLLDKETFPSDTMSRIWAGHGGGAPPACVPRALEVTAAHGETYSSTSGRSRSRDSPVNRRGRGGGMPRRTIWRLLVRAAVDAAGDARGSW